MQEDIIIQISNRLKEIRKDRNVTLQELAEKAGITKSMLSQVENSRSIPSLSVLLNLIKGLEVDLNEFFKNINLQSGSKVIFKKKSAYQYFEKENAVGFYYQRIFTATFEEYHLDFVLLRIEPGAQRQPVSTQAFEFKYLLQGNLCYTIGEDNYDMEAGDSLFFDATELHNPVNTGKEDALLLVVYFFLQKG
ncbi:MAG: helix-turn-helix domain-containing protein [Hydrotalea flava]|uniref:helix-turn-helix domain-containing protein n=1 Tax=Hydrotalea TaxID=1004300 RepID=UPI000942FDFA|nr:MULTISPECIES: XRE family transcriptional regulator [Hydrotalea]NIM35644.1 helix-turn-helix domain-containing protein [Hydrotalea flava]GHU33926.1 transcriptional regulator [Bacilli bacterium]NIM38503.1 helix-turn-helix domain-containing protein [Hydrotalea flava]NIN03655.1 helix-turn-helix domain-containing protein [Hydrotalea flava]NIN15360.1 helix-turn-helix domain-containing protein [Hydrotalea flava]